MNTTLPIIFSNPSVTQIRNNLVIEQGEWVANTGFVTKAVFFKYLYALLMGIAGETSSMDCGISVDNTIASNLIVYPSNPTLEYSLRTTYGQLSSRSIQIIVQKEVINFSLSNSASLKYPLTGAISYAWVGPIYNYYGHSISAPSITIQGDTLFLSDKVYGSLSISYPVMRHTYILTATARDEGDQDLFGAVVYAPFTGGISWLGLSNPPYVDEIASGDSCGGVTIGENTGGGVSSSSPPKFCKSLEIKETYDYCSGDLTGVTKTYV